MLGAGVEVQRLHLLASERAARDHPLDGLLEHALGEASVEDLVGGHFLDAAGIAGVLVVGLLTALVAGEADLLDVDDHDVVAAIDVRGEARLVLAAQDVGDDRGEAADDQPLGIDQVPFLLDLGRLDRPGNLAERFHGSRTLLIKHIRGTESLGPRGAAHLSREALQVKLFCGFAER